MNEVKLNVHQPDRRETQRILEVLAEQQAVQPLQDFQRLRGDFWPEDETPDAFVETLRNWRREEGNR